MTREDCARAAAALASDGNANRILDITGSEALTSDRLVAIASEVTGKPLAHMAVSPADFEQALLAHGLPPAHAELYKTFDISIANGELAEVTSAVRDLTGRAPITLREYLTSIRTALI